MVSAVRGNAESVSFATPVAGHRYYIMLKSKTKTKTKTSVSGVTAYATYD